MGISCRNGGTYADSSTCRTDGSRNFRGAVTPALLAFEADVLRREFSTSVAVWEQNSSYHAYHLVNTVAIGRTIPISRVWYEFARRPAPRAGGAYEHPVKTGDWSVAMAMPTMGRGAGVPIPLPGGPVVHHVNESLFALINVTRRGHVLHPGHIMRWIAQVPGPRFEVHTVGRGTTMMARTNETMGLEIFDELDMAIKAAVHKR